MATPQASSPGRSVAVLFALIAIVFGAVFIAAPDALGKDKLTTGDKYSPRLGLDLEGGTSVILTPRTTGAQKGKKVSSDALNQAVKIIRSRVDSFGVAEAEVTTAGNNIVISVPGSKNSNILDTVRQTAELRFRPVLAASAGSAAPTPTASGTATPSPSASGAASPTPSSTARSTAKPKTPNSATPKPSQSTNGRAIPGALRAAATPTSGATKATPAGTAAPTQSPATTGAATPAPNPSVAPNPGALPAGVTPALAQEFATLDCSNINKVQTDLRSKGIDDPKKALVTCLNKGDEKYILGPAEVLGTDIKSASAGLETNSQGVTSGGWQVVLDFKSSGSRKFSATTRRLAALQDPLNRFGIVLDGLVVSAPGLNNGPITGGSAQITGNFSQSEARDLANVLKYGALPLTFDAGSVEEVSPTLGGDQLHAGLVAGAIGLGLVVLYSLLYYRGLGLVTVASLMVASLITYGAVVLLGWQIGFRLSLAGIAGLIVAVGITADSFIVFFERLRDEVRDGRTLRVAVETGWVRARRTILAADFVSFLAALVLYFLSVGGVRGFAFTLGLTTLIDIAVVFLFTKPLVTLLARTKFYGDGHKWSGLDAAHLGVERRTLTTTPARRRGAPAAGGAARDATPAATRFTKEA